MQLVDHHTRCGCFHRVQDGLGVESIGGRGFRPQLAQTIKTRASASHADYLMAEGVQCAHKR